MQTGRDVHGGFLTGPGHARTRTGRNARLLTLMDTGATTCRYATSIAVCLWVSGQGRR